MWFELPTCFEYSTRNLVASHTPMPMALRQLTRYELPSIISPQLFGTYQGSSYSIWGKIRRSLDNYEQKKSHAQEVTFLIKGKVILLRDRSKHWKLSRKQLSNATLEKKSFVGWMPRELRRICFRHIIKYLTSAIIDIYVPLQFANRIPVLVTPSPAMMSIFGLYPGLKLIALRVLSPFCRITQQWQGIV